MYIRNTFSTLLISTLQLADLFIHLFIYVRIVNSIPEYIATE